MSGMSTGGPDYGRLSATSRVIGLLGVAVAMLGAHYRPGLAPVAQIPYLTTEVSQIHLGAGSAATLTGWSATQSFRIVAADQWGRFAALDSAEQTTVLKLNRIDERHLSHRTLVVPDSIGAELDYAPFPATVPALTSVPKFIAVSRRVQAFGAYEYGRLVHWGPTSTGKRETPTDSGLVFTNWKSRRAVSTDDPSWILNWYFNLIAVKGVAFHEYELPGRPASHGCVRLLQSDAQWIYGWADQWVPGRGSKVKRYGTPVLIFGDWDYAQPAPWLALAEEGDRANVSEAELEADLAPNLDTIVQRAAPADDTVQWRAFLSTATLYTAGR